MKLSIAIALLLLLAFTLPSASGSECIAAQPISSPLYEYRYNQALEGIGLANQGSAESKMSYGSISTSSLNPRDTTPMVPACQSSKQNHQPPPIPPTARPTCGLTCYTCSPTCFVTCKGNTCQVSCRGTCKPFCSTLPQSKNACSLAPVGISPVIKDAFDETQRSGYK